MKKVLGIADAMGFPTPRATMRVVIGSDDERAGARAAGER